MNNEETYDIKTDTKKKKEIKLETGFFSDQKNILWVVCLALFIGILVSVILIDYSIGINYFIFAVAVIGVTGFLMYKDGSLDVKKFIFWCIAFLCYASVFFRLKSFTPVTMFMMPFIYVLTTIYSTKGEVKNPISKYFYRQFGFLGSIHKFFAVLRPVGKKEGKKKTVINILVGLGISIVLLFIIIPLMLNADDMFDMTMANFFKLFDMKDVIVRVIASSIVTILFFAYLYTIIAKRNLPKLKQKERAAFEGEATIITVLVVIGLVYTLFAIIQFSYLFIGVGGVLPEGYSYAAYAVDGYWEQMFLTVINFAIISVCVFLTKSAKTKSIKAVNILLSYFIGLNIYLLFSAGYKMHLYQKAYGFTFERVLVYLLLLFELIMLVMLIIKIFKRDFDYIKHLVYIGIAYFAIVSFMNIEAFSVNQNIKRYEKTGEIDAWYISYGCKDATTQLKDFYIENFDKIPILDKELIATYFYNNYNWDETDIEFENYEQRYKAKSWLEFNISDMRLYNDGKEVYEFVIANE